MPVSSMFLIRQAGPEDFSGVYSLARLLDSYNLPADRTYIRELLRTSRDSFAGRLPKVRARYLFVIQGTLHKGTLLPASMSPNGASPIVGCSLIIAKHGTQSHPHLWFAQEMITKRSRTLPIRRSHPVLRMGYTEDGPTEVGGLVVLPRYRRLPERCGLQISYARFLYMAMHPERFEREVLIEYRGAMGAGGKSPFWEAIGRVFTGLPYGRADRLSVTNKEFILNLLPSEPIYCALLPESVQRAIGAIHPSAQGAAHLAERVGFRRISQVEPFDGGPYYLAPLRRITLVRQARRLKLEDGPVEGGQFHLVGTDEGGQFRAALVRGKVSGGRFRMDPEGFKRLNVQVGGEAYVCAVSR